MWAVTISFTAHRHAFCMAALVDEIWISIGGMCHVHVAFRA